MGIGGQKERSHGDKERGWVHKHNELLNSIKAWKHSIFLFQRIWKTLPPQISEAVMWNFPFEAFKGPNFPAGRSLWSQALSGVKTYGEQPKPCKRLLKYRKPCSKIMPGEIVGLQHDKWWWCWQFCFDLGDRDLENLSYFFS